MFLFLWHVCDSPVKAESGKSLRIYSETARHVCFPVASRAIRLLSKLIRTMRPRWRRRAFKFLSQRILGKPRGAARARLLYTRPVISYGRRFRPITLTRLTRGIQSANARGGLRRRSFAALRAKSPNNARWEFREICTTRWYACTQYFINIRNFCHRFFDGFMSM